MGKNNNANKTIVTEFMLEPHGAKNTNTNNNICQSQGLEISVIPYSINQLIDSQL